MAIIQGQYKNTNIETLLKGLDKVFTKHTTNLMNHCINDVYNLKTAKGYGLDMWGKLLGFPRYLPTKEAEEVLENDPLNFYEDNFYKAQFGFIDKNKINYMRLDDLPYRNMLNCITLKMTTNCTLENVNNYCKVLFSKFGGSAFIKDSEDMEFTYFIFRFKMPDWFKYIIDNYDILPRAAGVGMKYFESESYYIGFKGQEPKDKRVFTNFYRARFKPNDSVDKTKLIESFVYEKPTLYIYDTIFYIAPYDENAKPPVTKPEKPTEKPTPPESDINPADILMIDIDMKALDKFKTDNSEVLAYLSTLAAHYQHIFKQEGKVLKYVAPTQEIKNTIQSDYEMNLKQTPVALQQYAPGSFGVLASHIMYYNKIENYDLAHLQTLLNLIEPIIPPKEQDGVTYTHRFKDFVIDLDIDTFSNNFTKLWIKELDSLITRKK